MQTPRKLSAALPCYIPAIYFNVRVDMNAHDEACYERIIRPQIAIPNKTYDDWITEGSEKWQRERVVRLRRYQAYECGGGNSLCADYGWNNLSVYPFIDRNYTDSKNNFRDRMYGCAGFETDADGTTLLFCWIHPFWRNKKALKKQWPLFLERFGSFHMHGPISKPMQAFLKAVKYSHPTG